MLPSLQGLTAGGEMGEMGGTMTEPMSAGLFIGMWVTMMVAMMFPSVAPMVITQWRIAKQRRQGPLSVPVFVGGYLFVWTLIGIGAFALYRATLAVAPDLSLRSAALFGGVALVAAGAYQLTPMKNVCLSHCRGPLQFVLHWRPGLGGAARMGGEHGLYCVGCCWGLMIVLFVVGLMNLAWMGAIAAVIFVEKIAPFGMKASRVVGGTLIALGAAMAVWPAII